MENQTDKQIKFKIETRITHGVACALVGRGSPLQLLF